MYRGWWYWIHFSLGTEYWPMPIQVKEELERQPFHFSMWWPSTLLWFIVPWLALAQPPGEGFKDDANEGLRIRPLPDGKVAVDFEFTILSKGKRPRHPKTLGQDDEGVLISPLVNPGTDALDSATLRIRPACAGPNTAGVRCDGDASHSELWEVDV